MAIVFALPKLYDDVVARFALDGRTEPNLFGWRPTAQKSPPVDRIIWTPGDDEDGALGELGAAKQPGGNPRSLATLYELFTVRIVAADTTAPENERAQYQKIRELYDAWYRACWLAARTTFAVVEQRWLTELKERRHGTALRIVCTVEAKLPDAPAATDATQGQDVDANLTTSLLDVSDNETIEGAE